MTDQPDNVVHLRNRLGEGNMAADVILQEDVANLKDDITGYVLLVTHKNGQFSSSLGGKLDLIEVLGYLSRLTYYANTDLDLGPE